jgi:succinate dehydrogenase / fumarate reductase cytochrome b subunit
MAASAESLRHSTAGLLVRLWRSSIGKKYVMAVTGLALWLFVIVHLAGNLQIFIGPDGINGYAATLKSNPLLLWGARLGLLAVAVLHVVAAIQLALINRRARPVDYAENKVIASTFAQRTIVVSGLILLAFILFHLAHFTIGLVDPSYLDLKDPLLRHDVYRMMITGFSIWWVSAIYVVSMALLALHLSHGISSLFQSLGLRSRKTNRFLELFARAVALILFIGNCAIPLAVLAGWVK